MRVLRTVALAVVTGAAAALAALLFRALGLPLALILGGMAGGALIANLWAVMPGGRLVRRAGQMAVGLSIGALLDPSVLDVLLRMAPTMILVAVLANLAGALIARPAARLAGVDRTSALLCCLPAGLAEMATLAREIAADEQAVTLVHTLRVAIVITLIPLWLALTGHPAHGTAPAHPFVAADLTALLPLLGASLAIAWAATRLGVINAFVLTPMLLVLAVAATGLRIPPVPDIVLAPAEVAIGATLGLRLRLDRLGRLPRIALGGLVSGTVLFLVSFFLFVPLVGWGTGLDPLSSVLSAAPGGLGEMVASAGALGILAAPIACFQLSRTVITNLCVAPLVRWHVTRERQRAA
ncbi:AbrB family transcriptional regulator [Aureimonas jatrophae]|uniref:AbrB family transcriptional regulator n=1 Tax=Aureimonas jatrophae TaxID=1166073 RepID=UPI001479AA36